MRADMRRFPMSRYADARSSSSLATRRVELIVSVSIAVLVLVLRTAALAGVNTWTSQGPGGGVSLGGIAIDPSSPATVYAATESGVFKSIDGGSSWTAVNTGLTNLSVRRVAIDPQTPSTLYAGADTNVFKSVNGGASWSAAGTGLPAFPSLFDLVVDPQTPTTLYVAIYTGDSHTG